MKNIIKNIIATAALFGIFVIPNIVSADVYSGWDTGYGSYDDYSSGYGSYDDYYSGYGSYDDYYSGYGSYDDYYSGYGSYDDYYSGYGSYDDYYSGYGSYDDYYSGYGSYDDYYSGYGSYDYNSNYSSYYNDYAYNYYGDSYYDYGYDDYGYSYDYGYDDYYGGYSYDYGYNDYYDYYDYGYGYDDYYDWYGGCSRNCEPEPPTCTRDCNPPQYEDLDLICIVSDTRVEKGDTVTFRAEVDGGKSPYSYRWSGDFTGTGSSLSYRLNQEGEYEVTVKVTDARGRTATANCDTVVVEEEDEDNDDFDAVCVQSETRIEKGDRVTFRADVDGGDSPFDYEWSGDAGRSDDRSFTARFNRSGRYEIDLKVTDDEGRVARDTCTIRVDDEDEDDDDDRDINVTSTSRPSTPTGNLSSVGSVYLNQIPYTGPEDVAKGIAFAVGILAWSIAGALIIRKKMNKRDVSSRIEAFKQANRSQN